jgi:hypothetical protein
MVTLVGSVDSGLVPKTTYRHLSTATLQRGIYSFRPAGLPPLRPFFRNIEQLQPEPAKSKNQAEA